RLSYRARGVSVCRYFFFQAEDGIRDATVTGVQTCALPILDCSSCTTNSEAFAAQGLAQNAASKAFAWVLGGLQINYSRRLNVFGQYIITSSSQGFLLNGNTHTLQGGVRYSLGSAREAVTGPR